MRFRSYPRIGGPTQPMAGTWVATEKIHGANFVIGFTADRVTFEAQAWKPGWLSGDELIAWALRLVNPARVASARSKVGTDPRAIEDELVLDVMIDLAAVFADAWRELGSAREAELQTAIRTAATAILGAP